MTTVSIPRLTTLRPLAPPPFVPFAGGVGGGGPPTAAQPRIQGGGSLGDLATRYDAPQGVYFHGSLGWGQAHPFCVNVRWKGARGDGVHDDYAAIAAAIAEVVAAGGGVVFFPPGLYLVSQSVLVAPPTLATAFSWPYGGWSGGVALIGAGRTTTGITMAGAASTDCITVRANNTGFRIEGISLVSTGANGVGNALHLVDSSYCVIRDVACMRWGRSLWLDCITATMTGTMIDGLLTGAAASGGVPVAGSAGLYASSTSPYAIAGNVVTDLHVLDTKYAVYAAGNGGFNRNEFLSLTGEGCDTIWDTAASTGSAFNNNVVKMHSDAPVGAAIGLHTGTESSGTRFGFGESINDITNTVAAAALGRDTYSYFGNPKGWFGSGYTGVPALPAIPAAGVDWTNTNLYPVVVSMTNDAVGVAVTDTNNHGPTRKTLRADVFLVTLQTGQKIRFNTTPPSNWDMYGLSAA